MSNWSILEVVDYKGKNIFRRGKHMKTQKELKRELETKTVIPFTIITFAITWGIALLFIVF